MDQLIYVVTSQQSTNKMPVDSVVEKLLPGDIILLENKWSPLAWLIRLFTQSWWTHAEIYVGNWQTVGAHFFGIKKQGIGDMMNSWKKAIFLRHEATFEIRDKISAFAISHVGDGYDFGHFFLYAWRIIKGTIGKAPMPDDPRKHVCLEFVAFCWHKFGISIGGIYYDNVTGKTLAEDKSLNNVF